MLKKQYNLIQAKVLVEFKNDKELPLEDLLELEATITSTVHKLAAAEVLALKIMEEKNGGQANSKE